MNKKSAIIFKLRHSQRLILSNINRVSLASLLIAATPTFAQTASTFYRKQKIETNYRNAFHEQEQEWHLETQIEVEEQLQSMSEQLEKLPKNVQRAYLLAQLDGMTYKQIASELKVSFDSIKYYLKIARKAIQDKRYKMMG